MAVARAGRRRRRVQPTTASTRARRRSPAISIMSTRSRPPTSTRSSSHFKNYNAEWDYRFGWGYYSGDHPEGSGRRRRRQLEERQRHRPVPARRLRAGQFQHLRQEPESTGARRRSTASSTSCRWSTRSSIAPSRMRRPSSPRCAPASSTFSKSIRWSAVDELKKSAPQLQWSKWLSMTRPVPGDAR